MNLVFAGIATTILLVRALMRKSLTTSGILAALLTAAVHAIHPWNLPFTLLITFYALGTIATKINHDIKAGITLSSSGATGGEGARNHIQVFANSIVASILIILHAKQLGVFAPGGIKKSHTTCFNNSSDDLLIVGIIANYAATLADTLSSECGIISPALPRLITTLQKTQKGVNGGVTLYGLGFGAAGATIIGTLSAILLPSCHQAWGLSDKIWFVLYLTFIGTAGSLLDSLLGALFQQSVIDLRTRKIVEAPNGAKVLVVPNSKRLTRRGKARSKLGAAPQLAVETIPEHWVESDDEREKRLNSRKVIVGEKWGVLSNNQVNLLMAVVMSAFGMVMWGGLGKAGAVVGEQVKAAVTALVKQELIGLVVKGILKL